jgi:hypothetical protein
MSDSAFRCLLRRQISAPRSPICRYCLAACTLWFTHCTGDAYLGAIATDAGQRLPGPAGATSASGGSASSPPSAARAGSDDPGTFEPDAQRPAFDAGGTSGIDAATPNAGDSGDDAGSPSGPSRPLCVVQPSFESAPVGVLAGIGYTQPPWTPCFTLQDVTYSAPLWVNETTLVDTTGTGTNQANVLSPASQGSTYLYLDTSFGGQGQSTSGQLCESLRAGQIYAFVVDLMARDVDKGMPLRPGKLEVYASPDGCSLNDGPLWTSPPVGSTWARYCARLSPNRDSMYLILRLPANSAGRSTISVDNIRVDPNCR